MEEKTKFNNTFNGILFLPFEQGVLYFSFALSIAVYVTRGCLDICIFGFQKICCFTSLHFTSESLCGCKWLEWVCVSRDGMRWGRCWRTG